MYHLGRLAIALVLSAALLAITLQDAAPQTASQIRRYGCDDIAMYQETIVSLIDSRADWVLIDAFYDAEGDMTTMYRSDLIPTADAFERWAKNVSAMDDVPLAMQTHHEALVLQLVLTSNVLYTYATGSVWDLMIFEEAFAELTALQAQAWQDGERMCGEMFTDIFGTYDEAFPAQEDATPERSI